MPIYRITVTATKVVSGQRIDKGLYVDIQSNRFTNPIYDDKDRVAQAFLYQRGVDIKKLNALNGAYLKATRLG